MDEQEELRALCFPLSRHHVDGTDICEDHVVACDSLLYHQSEAGFVLGYGLYEIISRIPFYRWAVLGIKKEKKHVQRQSDTSEKD